MDEGEDDEEDDEDDDKDDGAPGAYFTLTFPPRIISPWLFGIRFVVVVMFCGEIAEPLCGQFSLILGWKGKCKFSVVMMNLHTLGVKIFTILLCE